MFRPEQLFQSSTMALKVRFLPRLDLCLECFMGSFVRTGDLGTKRSEGLHSAICVLQKTINKN